MEYEELVKKLAFNIKIARMKKNLTQAELAELINVHEKYIGKIETGKQNITVKTLNKISNALNIDIPSLFI
jgi:transcriptional regulator with XRE-family HTH domain